MSNEQRQQERMDTNINVRNCCHLQIGGLYANNGNIEVNQDESIADGFTYLLRLGECRPQT